MPKKPSPPQLNNSPRATTAPPVGGGIEMSLSDRWLILGTTGSGKTTFCRELVQHLLRLYRDPPILYILDTKGQGDFDMFPNHVVQDHAPKPIKSGIQVWEPGIEDFGEFDEWFGNILHAPGSAIVLVDEISSITEGDGEGPDNFKRLMKQGRGKRKCVINCTQEVAGTPRQIRGQTTHVVRFRLQDPYDIRNGNALVGRDRKGGEPRAKYGFFYGRADTHQTPVEYRSYTDFF